MIAPNWEYAISLVSHPAPASSAHPMSEGNLVLAKRNNLTTMSSVVSGSTIMRSESERLFLYPSVTKIRKTLYPT